MAGTWECPQCHRRVPANLTECRCGAFRPRPGTPERRGPSRAGDIPGPRFSLRGLPRPVAAALGVIVVSAVAGLIWMFLAPEAPKPFLPLLGYIDRPAPTPPPTPTPVPKTRRTLPTEPPSPPAETPEPVYTPH